MSLKKRICSIISDTLGRELDVNEIEEGNIITKFSLTSIDALEIYIKIEGEFDIQIDDSDLSLNLLSNYDELESYINSKITI